MMQSLIDPTNVQCLAQYGYRLFVFSVGSIGKTKTQKMFRQAVVKRPVFAFNGGNILAKRRDINIGRSTQQVVIVCVGRQSGDHKR